MLPILHQSLWRDEAWSVFIAERPLKEIFLLVTKDIQSPLYYFLLHYWMPIFGNSEPVIRSLSILFHLALGVLGFLFIFRLTQSKLASLLTSLAILFNPFLITYSFEARPYSLLAFLTTLAVYLLIVENLILASVILVVMIFTHNFGLLSLAGVVLWWLWFERKEVPSKIFFKNTLKLFGLPGLSLIFWAVFVWHQWTEVVEAFWIKPVNSDIFLQTFQSFFGGPAPFEGQKFLLMLVVILVGFVTASWIVDSRKQKSEKIFLLLLVALTPITISFLVSALWVPIFHERYVIAAVPLLIIFSAFSLERLLKNGRFGLRYFFSGLLAIWIIVSLQSAERITKTTTKPAVNWAVAQILSQAQTGDVIIPQDILNFWETKYYVRKAGASMPVYAYAPSGKIIWYANATAISPAEIIRVIPKDIRVWQVKPDGGYSLLGQ